jgi:2-hydroxy-3-keto-5-methylthiopentenyl-1-phosphate phosphatase
MIKVLKKLEIEGTFHNVIKFIHDKPIANIILNGGETETIFSKLRNEVRVYTLLTLIQ